MKLNAEMASKIQAAESEIVKRKDGFVKAGTVRRAWAEKTAIAAEISQYRFGYRPLRFRFPIALI